VTNPYRVSEGEESKAPMQNDRWFLLSIVALLVLFVVAAAKSCIDFDEQSKRHSEAMSAELPARQQAAEGWLSASGLSGRVLCSSSTQETSSCDVVPRDARGPFVIECSALECSLRRSR
jgi:hypothetical protein